MLLPDTAYVEGIRVATDPAPSTPVECLIDSMGDVYLSRQSQECHTQDESEAFHFGFAVVGSA